jgi:hypothetical protein
VGAISLYANTSGEQNVAVGREAARRNTTGNYNTAVGFQSFSNNTTGSNSTALGYNALGVATTGTVNTAVGYLSGNAITTGSKNTILGSYTGNQSGLDIRTANNNIVLSDGDGNPGVRSFKNLDYTTSTTFTTIAQKALGLGPGTVTAGTTMMVVGNDNDRNTAVRYSVPYATNKWDHGNLWIQISSGKGDASLNTSAWFFYRITIYLGSLGVSLADSGGDTGSFTMTISDDGDSTNYANTMILGILGQSTTVAADNTTMFCNLTWYNGSYEAWRYA